MSKGCVWIAGILFLLGVVGQTGCQLEGPLKGTAVTGRGVGLETQQQVSILDKSLEGKFSFHDEWKREGANGRMEIGISIRNRTNFTQNIDVSTIFRDESNLPINDESAWTRVILGPNETKNYTTVSINSRAKNFTVRVREGQ
jgi:hypothetical protein